MGAGLRLISLAPTQTEIVTALGAIDCLIGVSENCDFPVAVKNISRFGSWYSPDLRSVIEARPDLVLTFGSHHEEVRSELEEAGLRVYHSDPPTITASIDTFREIAAIIGREESCSRLISRLTARLERIRSVPEAPGFARRPSIFRIMNYDPLITVGPGAFQHDVIEFAGGSNVAADGGAAYFVCNPLEIQVRDPEIIFFCEPHVRSLLESDPNWLQVRAVRNGRIFVFDCGLTCRSGPRIVDMAEQLHEVILNIG